MSTLVPERHRIAEIDDQILLLLGERETLERRLDTYKYPVLNLPNEIVSEFFIHVLPPYPSRPLIDGLLSPTVLGHVCRRWRDIAFSTPALWRAISVSLGEPRLDDKLFRTLETWLSRSESLPLSLSLSYDSNLEEDTVQRFLGLIIRHCPRLQYLELSTPIRDPDIALLQHRMPMLCDSSIWAYNDAEAPTPVLHEAAQLHNLTIPIFRSNLMFPWSQLTRITCYWIDYRDFGVLLEHAANLVHCKVALIHTPSAADDTPIEPLLRLETLILTHVTVRRIPSDVLGALTVPALRQLHVDSELLGLDPIGVLDAFISRTGASLQELCIMGRHLRTALYRQALPDVPTLLFDEEDAGWDEDDSENDSEDGSDA
ncbi:hypothetical protein C8R43DRAFT_919847 [Mycena crocata]|nr:hypothetical protein C8R43DRAFT_919847 [Mycena crocata]